MSDPRDAKKFRNAHKTVICAVCLGLFLRTVCSQQAPTDKEILLNFKKRLRQNTSSVIETWDASNSTDPCSWFGVNCTSSRVTSIKLEGSNLQGGVGAISVLASLSMLKSLTLTGNDFSNESFSVLRLNSSGNCSLEHLDLSENHLNGNLTESVFIVCRGLQSLNLTHNGLSSGMSMELFRLPAIRVLDLSHNSLSGSLQTNIAMADCRTLQVVKLAHNNFTGSVPQGLGFCPKLTQIDLSNNSLIGCIPADLFSDNCSAGSTAVCTHSGLAQLNISFNYLTGSLPITNYCKPSLQILDLSHNKLSNGIPAALGNCSGLGHLNLSLNNFSGEPQFIFPDGCALQLLDLSANSNLSGPFPLSLLKCTSLRVLILAQNTFIGEIPNSVGRLTSLEKLLVGGNNFSGTVPAGILNCSNLQLLDLCSNKLSGKIPGGLCTTVSKLSWLYLQDNRFSGSIPSDLSNCRKLVMLDMSFNQLTGVIPRSFGNLSMLVSLILWNNDLTGTVPAELSMLQDLRLLILNNNRLQGPIPVELSHCTMLEWLSLSNNNLTGSIPSEIFNLKRLGILQLGNNSLSGAIPSEISNSTNLFWIDFCFNKLTGIIPYPIGRSSRGVVGSLSDSSVGYIVSLDPNCDLGLGWLIELAGIRTVDLSQLLSCETRLYTTESSYPWVDADTVFYLDLSYNNLDGQIPTDIGSMNSLQVLSLSHNIIGGSIPSSIGHCSELISLDLSSNSLSGTIPSSLTNLTLLSALNLSSNDLYGSIPEGGQLMTFPSSVYSNNLGLCGRPLSISCPSSSVGSPTSSKVKSNKRGLNPVHLVLVVVFSIGGVLLIIFFLATRKPDQICCWSQPGDCECAQSTLPFEKMWDKEVLGINVTIVDNGPLTTLTYGDILLATDNFDPKYMVGIGGFGEVYRAEFEGGTVVAIKKLIQFTNRAEREFLAEMEILSKVKHNNLVRLLGYCTVREERLLLFEYMFNGSLDCALHGGELHPCGGPNCLSWALRKQIALDAAKGLAYLHHSCEPYIIHRDFKSSNVLLDRTLGARVADFGLARLINECETHLSVSTLAGTPGYVPPEYYQSFRCTRQGDVYSYGVVLLELISGRRPTDRLEELDDSNLVEWTKKKLGEDKLEDIIDPFLRGKACEHEILRYITIAFACVEDAPVRRPTMLWVVANLNEISTNFQSSQ